MAVRNRVCGPTQCGITALTPRCTKGGCKLDDGQRMPGAGLSCRRSRKAPLGKPTFQPYWGKPAVRNDRGIEETSASFEARSAPRSYPTTFGSKPAVEADAKPRPVISPIPDIRSTCRLFGLGPISDIDCAKCSPI